MPAEPCTPRDSRRLLVATSVCVLVGCATWFPDFVQQSRFGPIQKIERLAVVPFYPGARLSQLAQQAAEDQQSAEKRTSAADAAALVTRFVTEAIDLRRDELISEVDLIPENDVQLAFEGQGQVTPRGDPKVAAMLVAEEFGANAVLLGEVRRYRNRQGSALGSMSPASVDFAVTLYSAPAGEKLWVARFDQTQTDLTSNLFDSARFPGGGSRFLTVAELAQWCARLIADKLPLGGR